MTSINSQMSGINCQLALPHFEKIIFPCRKDMRFTIVFIQYVYESRKLHVNVYLTEKLMCVCQQVTKLEFFIVTCT